MIILKNYSIWQEYLQKDKYDILNEDLDVDVLIIGGGLTGLSTGYFLMNNNLKVIILEKNTIGSGITSKSTAKVSFIQEDMYAKIMFYRNYKDSYAYYKSQIQGLNEIKGIIEKYKIDCDFEKSNSYLYSNKKNDRKIKKEHKLIQSFNVNTIKEKTLPNNMRIKEGFYVEDVYTFNPVKYLNILAENVNKEIKIYENSNVTELIKNKESYTAYVNNHKVKAKYVVLACHYPFFLFPYLFPFKSTLQKSYIVSKKGENIGFNAINLDKPLLSMRYYKDYEIYLSLSHNIAFKNNETKNFEKLNYEEYDYAWSNIDVFTKDFLPYIGKINKHLLIGTGYAAWGMINSHVAGRLISDIILNRKNDFERLFNPKRISVKSLFRYPIIIFSNAYSFIKNKIFSKKQYLKNIVYYKHTNNGKIAVYIDEEGNKHKVKAMCPHIKCTLIFNKIEKTWDCPCHGSRFDIDGKCISGPSKFDIKID